MREKVVLAYSGGLDTSIIIPWLKENYDCDVIAMIADVGQGDDVDQVAEKAYNTGAAKVHVVDLPGAISSVTQHPPTISRRSRTRVESPARAR